MEASRIDRVRIDVQGNVVEISWAERDWLLAKVALAAGFETIIAKLHAVGAGRPVELDFDNAHASAHHSSSGSLN